jgi:hypothetical protein
LGVRVPSGALGGDRPKWLLTWGFRAAGVEFRSLRNWHITVLREAGFPLEFIGRRVGHDGRGASPFAMTASYTVSRMEVERQMTNVIKTRLESILELS